MDLQSLVNYVTMVAAGATILAVQLLKSPLIPLPFQKYPVPTTILATAVATYFALLSQHFSFAWHNWTEILGTGLTILLVAVLTYNHAIQQWPAVKSLEAPRT